MIVNAEVNDNIHMLKNDLFSGLTFKFFVFFSGISPSNQPAFFLLNETTGEQHKPKSLHIKSHERNKYAVRNNSYNIFN